MSGDWLCDGHFGPVAAGEPGQNQSLADELVRQLAETSPKFDALA